LPPADQELDHAVLLVLSASRRPEQDQRVMYQGGSQSPPSNEGRKHNDVHWKASEMSYKTGLTAADPGAASREDGADMNQPDCDRIAFRGYDDAVRRWIPTMNLCMLGEVIFDLSEAPGALWGDVGPQIAPQRDLLRLDVLEAAEVLLGHSWPIEGDALLSISGGITCR
jgi:hypothetical protein